ncbi:MAG: phosphoribosylanthranilate isomerase [Rhizobiales bacterium]|nr:phosphoribosylanthranilate isomerase [Hyphomicrobiales bacterium]NRB14433.1 phosphoribosylanthranilate isomerase [Hyphomicrobiales bacterium]
MKNSVKICGIKSTQHIEICATAGADYVGFVNFVKSPRHLELAEIAPLIKFAKPLLNSVVLKVNPSYDDMWDVARLEPDYIQLHGDETPLFCQDIKATTNLKVIKAISVETMDDIVTARAYEDIVDILLFDTKSPKDALLPGGNGQTFDWALLSKQSFNCQTMLAGGLNHDNVQLAMKQSGINQVDVSTEVEITRGVKDPALIEQFISSAKE